MKFMQENKTTQEYADKLMKIVNHLRMLGEELLDKRIVQKVLVSIPERFDAKISSLEDSKDLTRMSLSEHVNSLKAIEKRRAIRLKNLSEQAF